MREYERHVAAVEAVDAHPTKTKTSKRSGGSKAVEGAASKDQMSEVASSSAQGSDTSNSDVPVSIHWFFITKPRNKSSLSFCLLVISKEG